VWVARVDFTVLFGWQPAGGSIATDPQAATVGNDVVVAALTSNGGVWYNIFVQGSGNNWLGWAAAHGTLQSVTVATGDPAHFFLAGKDPNDALWWYDSSSAQWISMGNPGLAAGLLSAAPR
jgi:hypothetical protein